jgi:hypothetical protein
MLTFEEDIKPDGMPLGMLRATTFDETTDMTTDETTSHSAMPPKNGGQAAGYSHLTKLANHAN